MARSPSASSGRKGSSSKVLAKEPPRVSARSTGSVTLGDVAKLAGVSPITVSRVLNRPELTGKGYRRFALVCAEDERSRIRRLSFMAALERVGLTCLATVEVPTPTTVRMGREGLARLLSDGHRPDAIFCSSDVLAHGVLAEAQSRGLTVPADLAVMGFADLDFAAYTFPSLSTVHVERAAMGRHAAEVLLARLSGRSVENKMVDIGFTIVERAST